MKILIVDRDALFRRELRDLVADLPGVDEVELCADAAAAEGALAKGAPALVVLDAFLPGRDGGGALAAAVRAAAPEARIVVVSASERTGPLDRGLTEIADDFLTKDSPADEIRARVAYQLRAARSDAAKISRSGLRPGSTGIQELIGDSAAMREVREWVRTAAAATAPVLITGESGCGKELAAWSLHRRSPWGRGPFVPFNAAAVSESLLEAELFGHARGAFTGADKDRAGVIEAAEGGSLFLDEIGELPLAFQVRFLRFLEAGTYNRVGEATQRKSRARLIFATNRDLGAAVEAGEFRKDLLFRLDVLRIHIPPLRERPEDILPLAGYLLEQLAATLGIPCPAVPGPVGRALEGHDWPGNVRELRNVLERALIRSRGAGLDAASIQEAVGGAGVASATAAPTGVGEPGAAAPAYVPGTTFKEAVADAERRFLEAALAHHEGNVSATARAIDVSRRTLQERMARYGLRSPAGSS